MGRSWKIWCWLWRGLITGVTRRRTANGKTVATLPALGWLAWYRVGCGMAGWTRFACCCGCLISDLAVTAARSILRATGGLSHEAGTPKLQTRSRRNHPDDRH